MKLVQQYNIYKLKSKIMKKVIFILTILLVTFNVQAANEAEWAKPVEEKTFIELIVGMPTPPPPIEYTVSYYSWPIEGYNCKGIAIWDKMNGTSGIKRVQELPEYVYLFKQVRAYPGDVVTLQGVNYTNTGHYSLIGVRPSSGYPPGAGYIEVASSTSAGNWNISYTLPATW